MRQRLLIAFPVRECVSVLKRSHHGYEYITVMHRPCIDFHIIIIICVRYPSARFSIMTRKKWSFLQWRKNQKFWQQQTGSTQRAYLRRASSRTIFTAVITAGSRSDDAGAGNILINCFDNFYTCQDFVGMNYKKNAQILSLVLQIKDLLFQSHLQAKNIRIYK